ncbi:MAG: sugar ABC transporter substrate-binding protein [Oscillospiraceae bacterium]|nr:sugar ABC transporter substrate-binding protein [Oscillospiraceae bacterium]
MKRVILIICALLLTTVVLVACGNGDTSADADGPSGNITVFFWDGNQTPAMENIMALLDDTAPNVNVELTQIPWGQYWPAIQIALASSNEPDVFWSHPVNSVEFVPAGLMEPLDYFIERDGIDMSIFPQGAVDMFTFDDVIYAIPKDFDTVALFYNRAIFEAQGVDTPTDNWTMDNLRDVSIALTEGSTFGFIAQAWLHGQVYPWMLSNGGTILSSDGTFFDLYSPENIEAVQWLYDAMYVHGFSPDGPSQIETDPVSQFLAGNIAMISTGAWNVGWFYETLGSDLGVAALPVSRQPASIISTVAISMNPRSENKDAAWEVIRLFTMEESAPAQAMFAIPAIVGTQHYWVNNFPGLNLQVFIDAVDFATPNQIPSVAAPEQTAVFDDALQNIWLRTEDIATALRRVTEETAAIAAGN